MPVAEVAELAARLVHAELREDRRRTLARYELALEATRRPELRALYDARGRHFRRTAVALLAAAGSNDPERHGDRLVAFAEGLMFYALAGAGAEPGLDDLRTAVRDFLNGVLR
ncbi:TetR family transcriptional regulator C-terminal domain-containing protein [Actinomadura sp. J1-007]|nr:TetR family transcriptional regulator C-terminal domain-containing protein [Actinomadura sp. J1-007]